MVRETRHLWVGNLPEPISEDRIREHFKRYGPVQSVKVVNDGDGISATVAFVDICSAAKAHKADHRLEERLLKTTYYEPSLTAISASSHHYPCGGGGGHHARESSLYASSASPSTGIAPLGARSPRFSASLSEDHNSYERSSHFYDSRRDESIGYNGSGGPGPPGGPTSASLRRGGYPSDREIDFGTRGRIRSYPPRNHFLPNGRAEPGDYRWGGSQYRYPDSYVDDKIRRTTSTPSSGSSPPPLPRMSSRSATANSLRVSHTSSSSGNKRRHPTSRSGSESPSSSRSSRSSSSSSSSSSCSSRSSSQSAGGSSRSTSRSPRRISGITPCSSLSSSIIPSPTEKRPFAISVKDLPLSSTDRALKEGLFHDYKKHGKVTAVRILGSGSDRYAVVCFKKPEDAEKAHDASQNKFFFGFKIQVALHEGFEPDDSEHRSYGVELDEYHPKATRTLFIGGLDKEVTATELRKNFEQFGEIIEIDIKKQGGTTAPVTRQQSSSTFAFCQYSDIRSVVQAVKKMDGEHLGGNRIKLGFGKSMPNRCIWIGGVADSVSEASLAEHFSRFGPITHRIIDRDKGHALITYESETPASSAVTEMRGFLLNSRRLQIDFASKECQVAFYENLSNKHEFATTPTGDRVWDRRETEKFERSRRDGAFITRQVQSRIQTYPARSRARYDGFDEYSSGRNYDEYADDSYERDLHEYAGRQRFENGPTTPHTSTNVSTTTAATRRHSFSPNRQREDGLSHSPRSMIREQESLSPMMKFDEMDARKVVKHRSANDQECYHSHSPPPNKLSSPRSKTSSRRPSRSPSTPLAMSPGREVTVLEDRTLPDPRRRRPNEFKDLIVRISDVKRPSESPIRLRNTRIQSDIDDDSANGCTMSRLEPQDPRLCVRREEAISSGDERSLDDTGERSTKKSKYGDSLPYDKTLLIKRTIEHPDSCHDSPSFRKPFETRKSSENKLKKDSFRASDDPLRSPQGDPRHRKLSHSGANSDIDEMNAWRNRESHYTNSTSCENDCLSDASPPGTPVRDEREEPAIVDMSSNRRYYPSHSAHYYQQREKIHTGPISLPLPKFAQQARTHLSPRGTSSSPRCGSILRSPTFPPVSCSVISFNSQISNNNNNNNVNPNNFINNSSSSNWPSTTTELNVSVDDSMAILADTPVSPGPALQESISDSENSMIVSPVSSSLDLEERIRALDEKYEIWTGATRAVGSTMRADNSENSGRKGSSLPKKHIPDLEDLKSQGPSDIVKSLLSKRSVFDEDSERLENFSDKYEPRLDSSIARPRYSTSFAAAVSITSNVVPDSSDKDNSSVHSTSVPSATPLHSLPGVRLCAKPVTVSCNSLQVSCSQVIPHRLSSLSSSPVTSPTLKTYPVYSQRDESPIPTVSPTVSTCVPLSTASLSAKRPSTNSLVSTPGPPHDKENVTCRELESVITTVSPDTRSTGVVSVTQTLPCNTSSTTTQSLSNPVTVTLPQSSIVSIVKHNSEVDQSKEDSFITMESSLTSESPLLSPISESSLPIKTEQESPEKETLDINISLKPIPMDVDIKNDSPLSIIPEHISLKRKYSSHEAVSGKETSADMSTVKIESMKVEPELKKIKLENNSPKDSILLTKEPKDNFKIEKKLKSFIKEEEKENVSHPLLESKHHRRMSEEKSDLREKLDRSYDIKQEDRKRDRFEEKERRPSGGKSIIRENYDRHRSNEKTLDKRSEEKDFKIEKEEEKKEIKKKTSDKEDKEPERRKSSDDLKCKLDRRDRSKDRKERSKMKDKERHRNSDKGSLRDRSKERSKKRDYEHESSKNKDKPKHKLSSKPDDRCKNHSDRQDTKHSSIEGDYNDHSKKLHSKSSKLNLSVLSSDNVKDDYHLHLPSQKSRTTSGRSRESTDTNESEVAGHEKSKDINIKKHDLVKHDKSDDVKHRIHSNRKSIYPKMKTKSEFEKRESEISSDDDATKLDNCEPAKRTKQRTASNGSGSRHSRGKKLYMDTESDTLGSDSDSEPEEQQPKKPSYFDITIYDGNMYDKVKARRVKSAPSQEEQKQQEVKQRLLQRVKKSKKSKMPRNGAISESEDSSSEMIKKRGNSCIHSSSEDEHCTRIRPNHLSSEESDSVILAPKAEKSKVKSVLKHLNISKNITVSDITTDDDTVGCSASVHNVSRSESDSEPISLRKQLGKVDSDSDISETGNPKPPRPSLSASQTKLKNKRDGHSKSHSIKESFRDDLLCTSDEEDKPSDISHNSKSSPLSDSLKERERTEGRMKALFGLSDDSDSNIPPITFGSNDLMTSTSYRKDSLSSLVSDPSNVSPQSLSRTPARVYESEIEDDFRPTTPSSHPASKLNDSLLSSCETDIKETPSPICKDDDIADSTDWRDSAKDTASEISRGASDSGKGSSSGVSTASSSSSGSCTEELMLLETSGAHTFKEEIEEITIKSKKSNDSSTKSSRKDKKKKKRHKEKHANETKHFTSKEKHFKSKQWLSGLSTETSCCNQMTVVNEPKLKTTTIDLEIKNNKTPDKDVIIRQDKSQETKMDAEAPLTMPIVETKEKSPSPVKIDAGKDHISVNEESTVYPKKQAPEEALGSMFEGEEEASVVALPPVSKASRSTISQEETLNAVAGLLACFNDYTDENSQPEDEIMQPDASTTIDETVYESEEAQKAAQILQSEMPGTERVETWSNSSQLNDSNEETREVLSQPTPAPIEVEPSPTTSQNLNNEKCQPNTSEDISQFPDSPASVQSEPALQIDEDQQVEASESTTEKSVVQKQDDPVIIEEAKDVDLAEPSVNSCVATNHSNDHEICVEPEGDKEVVRIDNNLDSTPDTFKLVSLSESITSTSVSPTVTTTSSIVCTTDTISSSVVVSSSSTAPSTITVQENIEEDKGECVKTDSREDSNHADIHVENSVCEKEQLKPTCEKQAEEIIKEEPKLLETKEETELNKESEVIKLDDNSCSNTDTILVEKTAVEMDREPKVEISPSDDTEVLDDVKEEVKESDISTDNNESFETSLKEESEDLKLLEDDEELSDVISVEEVKTLRGRARGRGRRGYRRIADTSTRTGSARTISTRSTVNTRSTRSRGRGRNRISECESSIEETTVRRSTRTKRARKHPDMVEHEETTNRRKRVQRGGKNINDEMGIRINSGSDVYDFHGSDEELSGGASKRGKRDSKSSPAKSPLKSSDDITEQSDLSKRKSQRLKEKGPDTELTNHSEVESEVTPQPPIQTMPAIPPVTRSRGRGKVKEDEEAAMKKFPRSRIKLNTPDCENLGASVEGQSATVIDELPSPAVSVTSQAVKSLVSTNITTTTAVTRISTAANNAEHLKPGLIVTSMYPNANAIPFNIAFVSSAVQNIHKGTECVQIQKNDSVPVVSAIASNITKDSSILPRTSSLVTSVDSKDLPTSPITPVIPVSGTFVSNIPNAVEEKKKSESSSMPLVDPVTGHLTPMKISEEGMYVPDPSSVGNRSFDPRVSHTSQVKVLQNLPTSLTVTAVSNSSLLSKTPTNTNSVATSVVSITRTVVNASAKSIATPSLPRSGAVSVEVVATPRSRSTGIPISPSNIHVTGPGTSGNLTKNVPDSTVIQQVNVSKPACNIIPTIGLSVSTPVSLNKSSTTLSPGTAGVPRVTIVGPFVQRKEALPGKPTPTSITKVINAIQTVPTTTFNSSITKGAISTVHSLHRPGSEFVVLTSQPASSHVTTTTARPLLVAPHPSASSSNQVDIRPTKDKKYPIEEPQRACHIFDGGQMRPEFVPLAASRYREPSAIEVTRLPRSSPSASSPSGRHPETDNMRQSYEMHVIGAANPQSAPRGVLSNVTHASSIAVSPKGNMSHYYPGREFPPGENAKKSAPLPPHPSTPVTLHPTLEPFLASPPSHSTPPTMRSPPPAHQMKNSQQRESVQPSHNMMYSRGNYIVSEHSPSYSDKIPSLHSLPMDLKIVEKNSGDKPVEEKDQRITTSVGGILPDYITRPPNVITPHSLSPHYDRSTDSPKGNKVHTRRFQPYEAANIYPNRAVTPILDRDGLSLSPAPHPYAPLPPGAEAHHQTVRAPLASPHQFHTQDDNLQHIMQSYPSMWNGTLGLKNDHVSVKMHFISGNLNVARGALPGDTPVIKISQRMRLEQSQLDGVARKMQVEDEHCILMAIPCGRTYTDLLQQRFNLDKGFIKYLGEKRAAGIVNVTAPGSDQSAYVIHIFPPCEFANENLLRISPELLQSAQNTCRLLVIIAVC